MKTEFEWQPIETAPKDGSPILVCGGKDESAKYCPELRAVTSSPCRVWWSGEDWLMAVAEAGYVGVNYEEPTHWMHLPELPLS